VFWSRVKAHLSNGFHISNDGRILRKWRNFDLGRIAEYLNVSRTCLVPRLLSRHFSREQIAKSLAPPHETLKIACRRSFRCVFDFSEMVALCQPFAVIATLSILEQTQDAPIVPFQVFIEIFPRRSWKMTLG
jgi:hypothetical protein